MIGSPLLGLFKKRVAFTTATRGEDSLRNITRYFTEILLKFLFQTLHEALKEEEQEENIGRTEATVTEVHGDEAGLIRRSGKIREEVSADDGNHFLIQ